MWECASVYHPPAERAREQNNSEKWDTNTLITITHHREETQPSAPRILLLIQTRCEVISWWWRFMTLWQTAKVQDACVPIHQPYFIWNIRLMTWQYHVPPSWSIKHWQTHSAQLFDINLNICWPIKFVLFCLHFGFCFSNFMFYPGNNLVSPDQSDVSGCNEQL